MVGEKFGDIFQNYYSRIAQGEQAEVKKIVQEIRSSWIATFVPLEKPNPLPLKSNPELKTDDDKLTAIENGLRAAKIALYEAETDDNYTLEGTYTWEMEAVLGAGVTPKDIAQDADVLVFLTRFLDRAYDKRDWNIVSRLLASDQRLPQATKTIVGELQKRDPLKVISDQIKNTWEISDEKYPPYKLLSEMGRITSKKAAPKQ